MKKSLLIALSLFSSLVFAQNEKTLFWEISGNGLAKKSYLYGTMHVSDKISYHLSDAFFKNLLNADIVSNESDPETWDETLSLLRSKQTDSPYNFYSSFYMNPIKKKELNTLFTNNNYFTSMLSGLEGAQSDFQENTVLDMFIYQTGRKYKKRIVGLESAKTSILSIVKIDPEESKPDEKNIEKLMTLIKGGNFYETLKTYYREKDIVMLDSIYKLMMSKKTHDIMIVNRNAIMTHSIDSLAQTGSLFSAVGAAHLSGKLGIIQLLKDKGYTVKPIIDEISLNGQKKKKEIEDFFPHPSLTLTATSDEMLKMPLNKKIIRNDENIGSPDFTNGGVINIKRVALNEFLNKKNERFNPKALDSLFFENIAGEIIDKKYFQEDNYSGYDITNKSKNGNAQHWRFYITPLELITVSMTGPGNYTRQYEKEVFDNIKLKSFKNTWDKINPKKGGFSVEVPSFNAVYGDSDNNHKNIEVQSYDPTEKAYYFLTERTLSNSEVLEDSEYEQKQIHYEFYLQHDIDSTNTHYDKLRESFRSESKLAGKKVQLKSVINGNKYYLMGAVNASESNSNRFFDSFKKENFIYHSPTKTFNDTIAQFQIDIPEKQNEKIFLDLDSDNYNSKVKNKFLSKSISYTFNSESGKSIDLEYYKFHKYESEVNIDSIKVNYRRLFLGEDQFSDSSYDDEEYAEEYNEYAAATSLDEDYLSSKKGFSESLWRELIAKKEDKYEILSESTSFQADKNVHVFEALVSKPNATQAVKYKVFFNEESETRLTTLVDRNYKGDDAFIEKTYQSFSLKNKNKNSVFEDKLKLFIEDVQSDQDTIRFSAIKSVSELDLKKEDFETITNFIDSFQFKDNETKAIEILISKIGDLEDPRVIPYFDALYKKEGTKTAIQISILDALSYQRSKLAYKKILELIEYDLPLSDNEYDISSLFYAYGADLENSKELFPKIFQFYSIKEYNQPIIEFCNKLFDNNMVSAKKLNSFKKIILTNAKLEYKRILSWKEKNPKEEEEVETGTETVAEPVVDSEGTVLVEDDYSETVETADAPVDDLLNYMSLIANFPEEEATTNLMSKIKKLDIPQLNIELLRLGMLNDKLSNDEILEALNNPKTRYITIQLLNYKNKQQLFDKLTEEEIAQSALVNFKGFKEKDKIEFLDKQTITNDGNEIEYFFFQVIKKVDEDEAPKKELYTIAFIVQDKKINPLAYKNIGFRSLKESDDIKELCQTIITKSINEKHFRASFSKQEDVHSFFPMANY
ncbi:TraB/GumN family protein [Flavobacterium sp. SUN046]|uniref:TraB/GumN family protein n=1 Tax=Flavobacterium sp. SUN046 TaxID=3002440 RepID=UPI002DB8E617|nr:TraB/GumN family protein [Flavobacterium sp. SUN046]MEC4050226.1 TraB/GumN family protein [Flavobacterium sp. SUN046]